MSFLICKSAGEIALLLLSYHVILMGHIFDKWEDFTNENCSNIR